MEILVLSGIITIHSLHCLLLNCLQQSSIISTLKHHWWIKNWSERDRRTSYFDIVPVRTSNGPDSGYQTRKPLTVTVKMGHVDSNITHWKVKFFVYKFYISGNLFLWVFESSEFCWAVLNSILNHNYFQAQSKRKLNRVWSWFFHFWNEPRIRTA